MLYQTHARIHLDHIRFNLEGIRRAVGPERRILIAVKANAYGHGAVEVSRMAERIGINWLGIATVPEGMQLRQAGIQLPILKFNPMFAEEMLPEGVLALTCLPAQSARNNGRIRVNSLIACINRPNSKINHESSRYQRCE